MDAHRARLLLRVGQHSRVRCPRRQKRQTIYIDKTIVGQPNIRHRSSPAKCVSIVFHPEWTVPGPSSRTNFNLPCSTAASSAAETRQSFREHNLKVSYEGRPVDAEAIDWANANIREYTFTQPPGPQRARHVKFNFPNKHAIYMHDTIEPELFAETYAP